VTDAELVDRLTSIGRTGELEDGDRDAVLVAAHIVAAKAARKAALVARVQTLKCMIADVHDAAAAL
jgi:hypothetical protein